MRFTTCHSLCIARPPYKYLAIYFVTWRGRALGLPQLYCAQHLATHQEWRILEIFLRQGPAGLVHEFFVLQRHKGAAQWLEDSHLNALLYQTRC
jgi:hypothetical protein